MPIQYQITLVPRSHPVRISLPVLKAIRAGVGFGSGTETSIRSENVCFLQSCDCIFSFLGFAVWVKLFCVCMSDSDHYLPYSGKLSREKTAYFCYFSFSEQCALWVATIFRGTNVRTSTIGQVCNMERYPSNAE